MLRKLFKAAGQDICYPRALQMFLQPLNKIQFGAVVRQPENFNVWFEILQMLLKAF